MEGYPSFNIAVVPEQSSPDMDAGGYSRRHSRHHRYLSVSLSAAPVETGSWAELGLTRAVHDETVDQTFVEGPRGNGACAALLSARLPGINHSFGLYIHLGSLEQVFHCVPSVRRGAGVPTKSIS